MDYTENFVTFLFIILISCLSGSYSYAQQETSFSDLYPACEDNRYAEVIPELRDFIQEHSKHIPAHYELAKGYAHLRSDRIGEYNEGAKDNEDSGGDVHRWKTLQRIVELGDSSLYFYRKTADIMNIAWLKVNMRYPEFNEASESCSIIRQVQCVREYLKDQRDELKPNVEKDREHFQEVDQQWQKVREREEAQKVFLGEYGPEGSLKDVARNSSTAYAARIEFKKVQNGKMTGTREWLSFEKGERKGTDSLVVEEVDKKNRELKCKVYRPTWKVMTYQVKEGERRLIEPTMPAAPDLVLKRFGVASHISAAWAMFGTYSDSLDPKEEFIQSIVGNWTRYQPPVTHDGVMEKLDEYWRFYYPIEDGEFHYRSEAWTGKLTVNGDTKAIVRHIEEKKEQENGGFTFKVSYWEMKEKTLSFQEKGEKVIAVNELKRQ